jgi:hypothetical protein
MPAMFFGIIALGCWLISFTAPKTKAEANERKHQKAELRAYE